jgi:hypothetical protein
MVLQYLLNGQLNGTTIGMDENVYCDLAINPFNRDCWIINRRVTPKLPVDANSAAPDYLTSLTKTLGSHAIDTVQDSKLAGRIFDFLNWATDVPSVNISDDVNDIKQALGLFSFLMSYPDILVAALATTNVQAVANTANKSNHRDRGQQFLGDLLTGVLNALQGTDDGQNSDHTDIAYKVGAVGWPNTGIPGRGIEIALPRHTAFAFLQTVLLDDVLTNTMVNSLDPDLPCNRDAHGHAAVRAVLGHDRGGGIPLAGIKCADGSHPAEGARSDTRAAGPGSRDSLILALYTLEGSSPSLQSSAKGV